MTMSFPTATDPLSVRREPAAAPGDPSVRPAELARLLEALNPVSLVAATSQGVILLRHLQAHDVAIPPLHGVVGRAGGWSAAGGRPVLGPAATAAFLAGVPGDLAVVPSGGSAADDLRALCREGPALVGPDGRRTEPAALADELLDDPAHELFVVTGLPRVHDRVRDLVPDAVLPAVRMTTLVSDAGEARVAHAFLRPLPEAPAGLPALRIDPDSGAIVVADGARRLPDWFAACDLVRRATVLLLPQRSIGWDVALTPGGPVVIDAVSGYRWVEGVGFDEVLAALRGALPRSLPDDGSP